MALKRFFPPKKSILDRVFIQVVLPPLISIVLFVIIIFQVLFPAMEEIVYERERDMIRNLNLTVWSLLDYYHQRELSGELTREDAQQRILDRIRMMRYGHDMKDYFWINDLHPRMIMHPYRTDLDGRIYPITRIPKAITCL
jgi:signal transduction histidine kinase